MGAKTTFGILIILCRSCFAEYNAPANIKMDPIHVQMGTRSVAANIGNLDIEEEFLPYILAIKHRYEEINQENFAIGKLRIIKSEVPLKLMGTKPDAVGECSNNGQLITIGMWHSYGECQKEELLTHEVGHCIFDMDHDVGGFMRDHLHSEEECEANLQNFRIHFYKNAKNYKKWKLEKDKSEKAYNEAIIDYVNRLNEPVWSE